MKNIKLGLLDLGYRNNKNSLQTINDIIEYGIRAEELNFSRIWLAEHHNNNSLHAYNNPEILLTLIAGNTNKIKVGSAGSLIGYYSPYSLVQNYKLLSNIFHNRIDFGLSKGKPSHSHLHEYFLIPDKEHINLFFDNLESITEMFYEEESLFDKKNIIIPPYGGIYPSLWYLSNSYKDFQIAIEKKLNYCRSLIHGLDRLNDDFEKEELIEYKNKFYKYNGFYPEIALALAITFTKTEDEISKEESKISNIREAFTIIPITQDTLYEKIYSYRELYGIDEFILYDTEEDNVKKIENITRISEKFKL